MAWVQPVLNVNKSPVNKKGFIFTARCNPVYLPASKDGDEDGSGRVSCIAYPAKKSSFGRLLLICTLVRPLPLTVPDHPPYKSSGNIFFTLIHPCMPNALIVDDEVDIWFLLSGILRKHNLKTYFVNNLAAATQRLQQDIPAILFLDNHLPDGFGLHFIKFIKKTYPTIKIILITGYGSAADRTKAFNDGADLFISKPFSSQVIDDALVQLL
jgi:two-component system, OmpR family, response regulator